MVNNRRAKRFDASTSCPALAGGGSMA